MTHPKRTDHCVDVAPCGPTHCIGYLCKCVMTNVPQLVNPHYCAMHCECCRPVIMRCSQILAMPSIPDPRMVADLGNTVDFLHRVRALKVRGAKGYVGTSNIVWNSLSYSLHICKNLLALWVSEIFVAERQRLSPKSA